MAASKPKVQFFSIDRPTSLKNTARLKQFIESVFKREGLELGSLNYVFCSDRTMLKINRRYLNHNFYTDVITFNLAGHDEPISGEVYISPDRIRENAKDLSVSIKSEFHRVLFHAALHLCGYDDKQKKDIEKMRSKEDELLSSYFAA